MPSVCFYFQVHQPYRLREFRFFDIGVDNDYEDVEKNRAVMQKVAEKCYLPMNALMLELIKRHQGRFRISFSMTGSFIDQPSGKILQVSVSSTQEAIVLSHPFQGQVQCRRHRLRLDLM